MAVVREDSTLIYLSRMTGLSERLIERLSVTQKYRVRLVPKRPGSKEKRETLEPEPNLKLLQTAIRDNILSQYPVSRAAHGYVTGRSIHTNVAEHLGCSVLYKLDLKGAFPSVTTTRVKDLLRELIALPGAFSKEDKARTIELLARILTFNNSLPQGAPSSPMLMNLLCYKMDLELSAFATKNGITFTRYSDDLVFSTTGKDIAEKVRAAIRIIIRSYGWQINRKKTKYLKMRSVFVEITGISFGLTNPTASNNQLAFDFSSKAGLNKKAIQRFRGIIHNAIYDSNITEEKIFGIIGWVQSVYGFVPQRLAGPFRQFLSARKPELLPKYFPNGVS